MAGEVLKLLWEGARIARSAEALRARMEVALDRSIAWDRRAANERNPRKKRRQLWWAGVWDRRAQVLATRMRRAMR